MSWNSIYSSLFAGQLTDICISPTEPNKLWASISGFNATKKVYYSNDSGSTWTNISDGLPNVPANCLAFEPNSPDRIYVGTDLGVYVKDTVLSHWISFNQGLPNTVVSDIDISNNQVVAATFGRGLWVSDLLTEYPQGIETNTNTWLNAKVYPNPANNILNISIESSSNNAYILSLISLDGRELINKTIFGNEALDISSFSEGIYYIRISGRHGISVKQIQIIR